MLRRANVYHGLPAVLLSFAVLACGNTAIAQLPPPVWNHPVEPAAAGVAHRTFRSATLGTDVGYNVLLPQGYASSATRYPVIYTLHGVYGDEHSSVAAVAPPLSRAMAAGAIPPVIVVFVNGADYTFYADSPDGRIPAETVFVDELIPHVDATYRTIAERRGRVIEGFSMGGFAALALAMKHVDLFGSVVAYAPALLEVQRAADGIETIARAGGTHAGGSPYSPALAAKNRQVFVTMFGDDPEVFDRHSPWALVRSHAATLRDALPLRIVIGTDDGLWNANQLFHALLLENGYDHELRTIDRVAHDLDALYEAVGVDGIAWHARFNGWSDLR